MRLHFSTFVLDLDTRELLRGNSPVALSPKAFELLSILVTERPKALAKSDLMDRLWPSTFVVEKNLANLIGEIREALGDSPSTPQFVRTVHRFGYAFREVLPGGTVADASSHGPAAYFRVAWTNGHLTVRDGEYLLGRDPDAAILLDAPGVSRRHAMIRIADGVPTIEDLGSKNGTFVGERRVEGASTLKDGDIIGVGPVKVTFRALQPTNTTETQQGRGAL
jgi:DNA-binding winged helix-turn-helix (wHTH) protein